jgi:selenocysteine lyase/cysteine desulfurase
MAIQVVRRAAFSALRPILVGWKSVVAPRAFHEIRFKLADSARSHEPGSLNTVGLVGLHAALLLLKEIGVANIARHLTELRQTLTESLSASGYQIVGPVNPILPTGITSLKRAGHISRVYQMLDDQGIIVSLRKDHRGDNCLRLAPHVYNTGAEIDRVLECLRRMP